MTVLPKLTPRSDEQRILEIRRRFLQREAVIGGRLFGPVPKGHRRQFFCLDEHTWVWHEEWLDKAGRRKSITTRYDVRPDGVLKVQDGQVYQRLSYDEARNLYRAVQLYGQRVGDEYRRLLQAA
jgi:hypothetical protein